MAVTFIHPRFPSFSRIPLPSVHPLFPLPLPPFFGIPYLKLMWFTYLCEPSSHRGKCRIQQKTSSGESFWPFTSIRLEDDAISLTGEIVVSTVTACDFCSSFLSCCPACLLTRGCRSTPTEPPARVRFRWKVRSHPHWRCRLNTGVLNRDSTMV